MTPAHVMLTKTLGTKVAWPAVYTSISTLVFRASTGTSHKVLHAAPQPIASNSATLLPHSSKQSGSSRQQLRFSRLFSASFLFLLLRQNTGQKQLQRRRFTLARGSANAVHHNGNTRHGLHRISTQEAQSWGRSQDI